MRVVRCRGQAQSCSTDCDRRCKLRHRRQPWAEGIRSERYVDERAVRSLRQRCDIAFISGKNRLKVVLDIGKVEDIHDCAVIPYVLSSHSKRLWSTEIANQR